MATIAVFAALGGGAYAAINLPENSVGRKQLKRNAVTGGKVRNGSLSRADLRPGTIPGTSQQGGGGGSRSAHEAWHEVGKPGEPAFMNGWANQGGSGPTAAFFRDEEGIVHLRGHVSGNGGAIMFQLPPGYRPGAGKILDLQVYCGCTEALNVLGPSSEYGSEYQGAVIPPADGVSLDGVSFPAEA
jgi:hypothetical protein